MLYRSAFVLAACLFVVTATPASGQHGEPIGQVEDLTGPAVVLRDGGPQALHRGSRLHRDDRVRTLEEAKLKIVFTDGSELILGAESKVGIARYAPDEDHGALELLRGILRVVVPNAPRWERFDVQTRNTVASVRSTQLVVVLAQEQTSVFVTEGVVDVSAAGQQVRLQKGDGTDVPFGAVPGDPVQWGQPRVDKVLNQTTLR